jgi:D-tyrosyl-tRNA(Tyr) deacylase
MRVLLQRVKRARVSVDGQAVGAIGHGFLMLVGFGREDVADGGAMLEPMARKAIGLRVFADDQGRMNRSVQEAGGGLLVVSQFTLHADCRHGRRPSFTEAAPPETARALFERFVEILRRSGLTVATGSFGAMMDVELVNDGPVTIWLDSADLARR